MAADDLRAWLQSLGLERYAQAFRASDVDADVLPELSEADLEKLGISLGHRKKLLKAIAELRPGGGSPGRAPPIPPEAAPEIEGERRQVTVLFADLAGYTELSRQLDAEEVHGLLERFFDRVDAVIDQLGGSVDKHIGDCVMAVFGAPIAHGNDAERAARAALAVRDATRGLSEELGRGLQVHIGVAAGQVVASRSGSRQYTVTGDSVNLASRLTDQAAPGTILISDLVRRMLPPRFICCEAGALAVKGLAEPVQAWHLVAIGDAAGSARRLSAAARSSPSSAAPCTPVAKPAPAKPSWCAAKPASARRAWSKSSRRWPRPRASPVMVFWCSISAPASARTRSGRWSAACSR
jgi:class 3 adenylate cyclase